MRHFLCIVALVPGPWSQDQIGIIADVLQSDLFLLRLAESYTCWIWGPGKAVIYEANLYFSCSQAAAHILVQSSEISL